MHIPRGHCWVEGDNRDNTVDSNQFGPVPLALITAKAVYAFSLFSLKAAPGKFGVAHSLCVSSEISFHEITTLLILFLR